MIIIDTREQKSLWDKKDPEVIVKKLDEGDYTTEELFNKAHAERKSGADLYGSIVRGHTRFCAEIERAMEKDISFAIFVECTRKTFIAKRFKGGCRIKPTKETMGKIINIFENSYPVEFIWCKNREDMKVKMCLWFAEEMRGLKIKTD